MAVKRLRQALLALLACGLATLLGARSAWATDLTVLGHVAGSATFKTDSYILGPWAFGEFSSNGTVSYCANYKMGPPGGAEGASALYGNGYDIVGGGINYILTNGYPSRTTVSGDSFSDLAKPSECARAATQLAIWMFTGDMSLNGDYVKDGVRKNAIEVCNGSARSRRCVAAAAALCQAAIAHDKDVSKTYVRLYLSGSSSQNMFYGVPFLYESGVKLEKTSSEAAWTDGNSGYSLEGAVYGVYDDAACTKEIGRITTDAKGTGSLANVRPGTVYVKELSASKGYALSTEIVSGTVAVASYGTVKVKEQPQYATFDPVVTKLDADTNGSATLGAGTLAGAVYEVTWTKDGADKPSATWRFTTGSDGTAKLSSMTGSNAYVAGGKTVFPIGTLAIKEVKAPDGYLTDPKSYTVSIKADQSTTGAVISKVEGVTSSDAIRRGDLSFVKIDADNGETLAGIPFKITSKTTGESHIVVTDAKGKLSTAAAKHTSDTNANDAAVTSGGTVDESKLSSAAGTWFSGTTKQSVTKSDSRGALPYDTYTVEELSVKANYRHKLVSFEVTVAEDSTTVDLGTVGDDQIKLSTQAHDAADKDKTVTYDNAAIEDVVSYKGVRVGEEYQLVTTLVVLNDDGTVMDVVDENDKPVTSTTKFTPTAADGTVTTSLTFSAWDYAGLNVVVYEELVYKGVTVATHKDATDTDQTVSVANPPALQTSASYSDGTKNKDAGKLTIVDKVTYRHFNPGSYVMEATLYDRNTGQPLEDANGSTVTVKLAFEVTGEDANETVEVTIPLDATDFADTDVVVFERAYAKDSPGTIIAYHEDIDDESQTVSITGAPIITTVLPPTGQAPIVIGLGCIGAAVAGFSVLALKRDKPRRPRIY